jgi:hypothetical protein
MNTASKQEYMTNDDELVTCENCSYEWDGYAQCRCYGIPLDDSEVPSKSTHKMTLRSHTVPTAVHPDCWDEHKHYGQCGQSCPCCRAEVGDTWGACTVCINK